MDHKTKYFHTDVALLISSRARASDRHPARELLVWTNGFGARLWSCSQNAVRNRPRKTIENLK
jgi:hypothetical protein